MTNLEPAPGGDDGSEEEPTPPGVDLAGRRAAGVRPDHGTPVDDRVRQLAPALRAPVRPAQRARRRPVRAAERSPAQVMAQSGAATGAPPVIARAHHGSVSREERKSIEEALKSGQLPAVVATSSLELGIDMGAVDLVIQIEAPPSVAAGLQRVGRAGHQVGAVSRGVVFPKHRGDLLSCAVVVERMHAGLIEELRYPRNPLDVLAQQIVAMVALDPWSVGDLAVLVRRAAPFAELPNSALDGHPGHALRAVPVDRVRRAAAAGGLGPGQRPADRPPGRAAARGHQRRHDPRPGTVRGVPGRGRAGGPGRRAGRGDGVRVAGGRRVPARLDLVADRGDHAGPGAGLPRAGRGRPGCRSGRATSRGVRSSWAGPSGPSCARSSSTAASKARADLADTGLDEWAVDNLLSYVDEQREAIRHLPDDRTVVVERFRDELGDWRLAVHCVLGAKVNGAWALAISRRLTERYGVDAQVLPSDDGIVVRLPDVVDLSGLDAPPSADLVVFDPDEIAQIVEESIGGSAMFAARFRECAARALLLPRRDPRRRQPLWQQRQRAAQLLDVAREYADFPVTLEAARECLQDVLDVPGLVGLMRDVAARRVRVVEVETQKPSPFARSLLFGYVGAFLYGGDVPLAERRAAALALDSTLLGELLGPGGAARAARPGGGDRDRAATAVARRHRGRCATPRTWSSCCGSSAICPHRSVWPAVPRPSGWTSWSRPAARSPVRVAGEPRHILVEDAGRYRDALGVALPVGLAAAYLEPVGRPDRRPRRPVRPHPRPVPRVGLRGPVRPRGVRGRADPQTTRRDRPGDRGRVHPGRAGRVDAGHRVVRHRGAAAAAPPLAGRAAPGDRAGTPGGAGRVPAPLAAGRRLGQGRGGGGIRPGAAAGRGDPGLGLGAAGAAGPGGRLHPGVPGRAVRLRRGGLGRVRLGPRRRRLDRVRLGRDRPAGAAAGRPGVRGRAGARRGAVGPGPRAGPVLPAADRDPRADRRRGRRAGRGLGPGLGRAGRQRHARPGPGAARRRRRAQGEGAGAAGPVPDPAPAAGEPARPGVAGGGPLGPTQRGRPVVPAARPGRQPDPAGDRRWPRPCSNATAC